MEPNSLQGGIGFFDLPLEIVTKICTLCDASVPSFLLVTCRTAEAILRSNLGDTKNSFWSALLDQQFGDKWLELIDGRYGFEHNTPLWQIYFALTQRAQVDFRKETAEDPVIPYPMLSNPTEHQKNDGTIKIVVAGEIQPGKSSLIHSFLNTGTPLYNTDFHLAHLRPTRPVRLPSWTPQIRGPECDPNIRTQYSRIRLQIFDTYGDILEVSDDPIIEGEKHHIIIVGTHLDQADARQVSVEEARKLANTVDGHYIEVSNKTMENVELPFLLLVSQLWRREAIRNDAGHSLVPKQPRDTKRRAAKKIKTKANKKPNDYSIENNHTDKKCCIQ